MLRTIKKISSETLMRRFLNGAVWSIAGSVLSSGLNLILWMIVSRILGKEQYGKFVLIQSTLGMVGIFSGFGLGATAILVVLPILIVQAVFPVAGM